MQKIKSIIKKIGAISIGAAMLGSTMTGALAASLADYPTPFVDLSAKKYDFLAVVGTDAKADDNIGVTSIVSGLSAAKVPGTSSGGTVSVSGGVSEDVPIGVNIVGDNKNQIDVELEDDDLSNLLDTTITFQGSDYDVSEAVELGQNKNVTVQTSLAGPYTNDKYEDAVVLVADIDSLKYYYKFDETIKVNATTSSDALEIKFLGKNLKITKVDAANKFTATVGAEYYMQVGDSVTVEGKEVKLVDVGSGGSVIVSVGGVQDTISAESTKTINGVELKNDDTFYTTKESSKSAAWIVAGKDATDTYTSGDAYVGEDENDPQWIWHIGNLNTQSSSSITNNLTGIITGTGPFIGVENDWNYKEGGDQDALKTGDCVDYPNNYVSVCMDSLTVSDDDYMKLTFSLEQNIDLGTNTDTKMPGFDNINAVLIETNKEDGIELQTGGLTPNNLSKATKTDKVWLAGIANVSVFYEDKDNNDRKTYAGNVTGGNGAGARFARILWGDTKDTNLELNASMFGSVGGLASNVAVTLTLHSRGDTDTDLVTNVDDVYMNWSRASGSFNALGVTRDSEEAAELRWGESPTTLGTKDENHRTRYGIVIEDPKSNGASDDVLLMIPSDQLQANVVVTGSAGGVSGTTTTGQALSTFAGAAPDAVLDTEVTNTADHNLILVGGPAVNRLSAQFLGLTYPAFGAASGLSPGEAILSYKANGDKAALIVAGWEAADTRRAATVLKNFDAYKSQFTGTEVKVTGTSSSPTIVSSA